MATIATGAWADMRADCCSSRATTKVVFDTGGPLLDSMQSLDLCTHHFKRHWDDLRGRFVYVVAILLDAAGNPLKKEVAP